MVARALRHFLVVGLGFGLAVGWALTFVVNNLLGSALGTALHFREGAEPYWVDLLMTLVSIGLITAATIVGSRVFRRHVSTDGIAPRSLGLSSLLYLGLVLVFVVPELSGLMGHFMTHMSHTYENPGEAWMMLSLPLLRLIVLPLSFVVVGRCSLLPARRVSATVAAP